jgi:hypothetical protein
MYLDQMTFVLERETSLTVTASRKRRRTSGSGSNGSFCSETVSDDGCSGVEEGMGDRSKSIEQILRGISSSFVPRYISAGSSS